MTQHKKCQMDYCDKLASKWISIDIPGREEKLGGWTEQKMKGSLEIKKTIHKKKDKLHVCKICYDTVGPEDFNYRDPTTGKIFEAATVVTRL